jgi:hypothetical protein
MHNLLLFSAMHFMASPVVSLTCTVETVGSSRQHVTDEQKNDASAVSLKWQCVVAKDAAVCWYEISVMIKYYQQRTTFLAGNAVETEGNKVGVIIKNKDANGNCCDGCHLICPCKIGGKYYPLINFSRCLSNAITLKFK